MKARPGDEATPAACRGGRVHRCTCPPGIGVRQVSGGQEQAADAAGSQPQPCRPAGRQTGGVPRRQSPPLYLPSRDRGAPGVWRARAGRRCGRIAAAASPLCIGIKPMPQGHKAASSRRHSNARPDGQRGRVLSPGKDGTPWTAVAARRFQAGSARSRCLSLTPMGRSGVIVCMVIPLPKEPDCAS